MLHRPSVMILERDADSRASLAEVLLFEGYDVEEAELPQDAVTGSLRRPAPDMVVADVWGAEGAELVTRLKMNNTAIVVLFTGAILPLCDRLRLLVNAIVLKPKTSDLLVELRRLFRDRPRPRAVV